MALMLALSLLGNLIVAFFIFVCVGLILIILLQKGRGGGLGSAFGGGGAGSLLGTKTGDFLTWVTIALVAGFLVLAVLMSKFMRPPGATSTLSAPVPTMTETSDDVIGSVVDDADIDTAESVDAAVGTAVDEAEEAPPIPAEPADETSTETTE